ncbi:MAG TPA: DUF2059 domain-containing protein [Pseudolabrys sp.]|nr:DUF2059 domain-containing protein [Pseudolabrys sp.]
MKSLLACLLLAFTLAAPARAQTPSLDAMAAATELAALMSGDTVGQMSAALTAQIWPNIERQLGPKVDAATLTELRGEFEQSLSSFTTQVMRDSPGVYARHFTADELRAMLAFYKSPVGQKALKTMPSVMTELGQQMAPQMQAFQTDLHNKMEATLKKHGYGK